MYVKYTYSVQLTLLCHWKLSSSDRLSSTLSLQSLSRRSHHYPSPPHPPHFPHSLETANLKVPLSQRKDSIEVSCCYYYSWNCFLLFLPLQSPTPEDWSRSLQSILHIFTGKPHQKGNRELNLEFNVVKHTCMQIIQPFWEIPW